MAKLLVTLMVLASFLVAPPAMADKVTATLVDPTLAELVFGSALAVQAAPIGYAVQSDGDDKLYRIDLATGVATAIGPVGFPSVEGLSFQPGTGVLFGVDDVTRQLLTIDLTTGAGMAVGALGITETDLGLTFDASGNLFMASDVGQTLYSVDLATGAATAIGAQGQAVTGLAFDGGTLFGLGDTDPNSLVTLNPLTGAATTVGALTLGSIATGDLDGGIDFDAAGVLWGLADNGDIFTIDTATGVATLVTTTLGGFEGLAILLDSDDDGIPDDEDNCPETPAGAVVNAEGCAIVQLCPCEDAWKNHGAYVRCVAQAAEDFVVDGLITEAEKDAIVSEAGASSCGTKHK